VGTPVLVSGVAAPANPRALPGAPDPAWAFARGGVRTELVARRAESLRPPPPAGRAPEGAHGPVLRALASGDRAAVDPAVMDVLRRTGTAHLMAISGFHVGLVAGVGWALGRWGLRPLALLRRRGLPRWPAALLAALAALAYAWIAGAPVSAQRAAAMVCVASAARAGGRRPDPGALLGLAALLVVAVDPAAVSGPGFQLSFGAVLGLLRVSPRVEALAPPEAPRPLRWLARSLAPTLGATAGTLAPAAWWFQAYAPWSPLTNLFAIPVVAVGVVPAAFVATWGPEALAPWAAWAGGIVLDVLLWALTPFAVTPWPLAVGPIGAAAATAMLVLPWRVWPLILVLALGVSWETTPPDRMRISFLDVGQGDAALVRWPDGRTMLVDGGWRGDAVLHWLRREGVRRLDVVAASHLDADHAGGLVPVVGALEVGELWLPEAPQDDPLVQAAIAAEVPLRVRPDHLWHPGRHRVEGDANGESLVFAASYAGRRVLFTGDVHRRAEARLRERGCAEVLKVPHHGARSSADAASLAAWAPSLAVVSAAARSRYGHPHPQTVARFQDRAVPLFSTAAYGTIEVAIGSDDAWLRHHRVGEGWSAWRVLPLPQGRCGEGWSPAPPPPQVWAAPPLATTAWRW
jgi:competence protein ComEC